MSTLFGKSAETPPDEPTGAPAKNRLAVLLINVVLIVAIAISIIWLPPVSLKKRLTEGAIPRWVKARGRSLILTAPSLPSFPKDCKDNSRPSSVPCHART